MATAKEIEAERQRHDLHMRSICGGPTKIEKIMAKPFRDVTESDWKFAIECLEFAWCQRHNLSVDLKKIKADMEFLQSAIGGTARKIAKSKSKRVVSPAKARATR